MHLTVNEGYCRLRICSRDHDFRDGGVPPQANASLRDFADDLQAEGFMRRHFGDPAGMHRLRSAVHEELRDGLHDVAGRSDTDVLRAAARCLASGRWRVVDEMPAATLPTLLAQPGSRAETFATPRELAAARRGTQKSITRTAPGRTSATDPGPAAPSEEELLKQVNQEAQAVTLEKAAERGTPFCAICAEMAAERAAAAAAADAVDPVEAPP